jgi:hypothetical protein
MIPSNNWFSSSFTVHNVVVNSKHYTQIQNRSMMMVLNQDRMKGLVWIWMFKSLQRCLAAGRFSNTNGSSGSSSTEHYHHHFDHSEYVRIRLGQIQWTTTTSSRDETKEERPPTRSSWRFWDDRRRMPPRQSPSSFATTTTTLPFRDAPPVAPTLFGVVRETASKKKTTTTQSITATTPRDNDDNDDDDHDFSHWFNFVYSNIEYGSSNNNIDWSSDGFDDFNDELFAEYYDEDDDNIFHLDDDGIIVTTRRNPTKHNPITAATTQLASLNLRQRKRTSKQQRQQQPPAASSITGQQDAAISTDYDIVDDTTIALTQPIIPISVNMDVQTGQEFADPATMDRLVDSGLQLARLVQSNEWVEWKMHDVTKKLLKDHTERELLERGDVLVYVGTAKLQEGHGSHLPMIKTKALLPLSAHDMAELLMDSSRVQIYNKMSLGRTDTQILTAEGAGTTKIVTNLTKPPIAKSSMVSCTLMHSRKLSTLSTSLQHKRQRGGSTATTTRVTDAEAAESHPPSETYLVVSRAVPGRMDDDLKDLPRNDILLGVNLLEDVPNRKNQCVMTAVTHVYSPALPTMLAKSMGVSSAINFVKDIRNACDTSSSSSSDNEE